MTIINNINNGKNNEMFLTKIIILIIIKSILMNRIMTIKNDSIRKLMTIINNKNDNNNNEI